MLCVDFLIINCHKNIEGCKMSEWENNAVFVVQLKISTEASGRCEYVWVNVTELWDALQMWTSHCGLEDGCLVAVFFYRMFSSCSLCLCKCSFQCLFLKKICVRVHSTLVCDFVHMWWVKLLFFIWQLVTVITVSRDKEAEWCVPVMWFNFCSEHQTLSSFPRQHRVL